MTIDLRRAIGDRAQLIPALLVIHFLTFAILATMVATNWQPLLDLDARIGAWAFEFSSDHRVFEVGLEALALVFNNYFVAAYLAVVAALAWWKRERILTIWIIVSTLLVLLGNLGVKAIFTRPRPEWDTPLHDISGWSFPSGHSAGIGLFAAVLILLTIVTTGRGLKRRGLIACWMVIALAVASSRVYLGVHYVSDVVAGLAFGGFVPLLLWLLIMAGKARWPVETAILTGTGRRRSAVVINPSKVGDVEEFKAKIRTVAANYSWGEPMWLFTTIEDPGHGQTQAALDAKVDLIVAAGGDGTIRAVCETAARSGVAIGILPHGTGNLLARNLQIPVNVRDAMDVVYGGQDRAIDLATFRPDDGESTSFLVMAGLGMDAMIMTGVNEDLKKKIGYLAYFISGAKALTFPRVKVKITVDNEEPVPFKARTVVVGNVGFLQGGIPLLPDAEIDDGLLDVVVIAPKRFLGWLSIVVRVISRGKRNNERLARLRGKHIRVEAEKPVPMQLDGDPAGEGQVIEAEVNPGIVLVRVPLPPPPAD